MVPKPLRDSPDAPKPPQFPAKPPPSNLPFLSAKELTAQNPYVPTQDIGAPQFVKAHPTFDGRGVTIAIAEGWGDLSHPTLQGARALDGCRVDKVVGILDVEDFEHDGYAELQWTTSQPWDRAPEMDAILRGQDDGTVKFRATVDVTDTAFEADGQTYIAPHPGKYRFGKFQRFWTFHPWITHSPRPKSEVGVLWEPPSGTVWVDTNADFSFRDEKPIHDFNQTHELGYFPPIRAHAMSFAVTVDPARQTVHIYESFSNHTTMVAAIAAGKGF